MTDEQTKRDWLAKSDERGKQLAVAESLNGFLRRFMPDFTSLCRGSGLDPDSLIRVAFRESVKEGSKLLECDPPSIVLSLMTAAYLGLEPSGVTGHAYLIPFKRQCTLMPGYKGLMHLARKCGYEIDSDVVYDRDEFEHVKGSSPKLHHRPYIGPERGEIVAAYAVAFPLDETRGRIKYEVMTREDLDKVRKVAEARGKSPAWNEWEDQMFRKAPIRRLAKHLPTDQRLTNAVYMDDRREEFGGAARNVIQLRESSVQALEEYQEPPQELATAGKKGRAVMAMKQAQRAPETREPGQEG